MRCKPVNGGAGYPARIRLRANHPHSPATRAPHASCMPGVDHRNVIDAQASDTNAMFPIWQRAARAEPKDSETQRAS